MSKDSLALGLIGCGYWGKNLARNFRSLGALQVLCDASPATLASYGDDYAGVTKTSSVAEVLGNPAVSAVAIGAPAVLHHRLAKEAILAGKDVFVEKPLGLNTGEGEELVHLAAEHKRILMVGHLLQYHPCIQKLKDLIAAGTLGKLFYLTSNRLNLGKIRREENALWSFAPHDISVLLSLVGNQLPDQVRCVGSACLTAGVADTTMTTLRFPDGVRAHVYVSWLNPFKEQKLTVVGSHGMVVFDDTRPWHEKLILYRDYLTWTEGRIPNSNKLNGESIAVLEAEPLRAECQHFLDCCRTRQQPRTDAAEGLRVLRVLQAAQHSLEASGEGVAPAAVAAAATNHFVHPTAIVDADCKIGAGTKIWHFVHVCSGARIGARCIFGQNVMIGNNVTIGNNVKVQNNVAIYTGVTVEDDVFLGPSCVLTNVTNPRSQVNRHSLYEKIRIRRGATVGANATIVPGVTLGRYCFISAGAVVTKDVADYALMVGVPARHSGWMSRHGHKIVPGPDGVLRCPESGLTYKETAPGLLRCVEVDEEAALDSAMTVGKRSYDEFKTGTRTDSAGE